MRSSWLRYARPQFVCPCGIRYVNSDVKGGSRNALLVDSIRLRFLGVSG